MTWIYMVWYLFLWYEYSYLHNESGIEQRKTKQWAVGSM